MKTSLDISWKEKMAFETVINGHTLIMDAAAEVGGEDKGPRPKQLILASLAGCTGMDVVSILKKMRVEVDDFKITVEADITEEHPKQFTKMHVIYQFKGKNLPEDKIQNAVTLSQEKYCGVSATLKKAVEMTFEIRIAE